MKYALLEHRHNNLGYVNIGDHIQSCAAKQFMPRIDFYVERECLNKVEYNEAKIIMNGWFAHAPENWPPNEKLNPLFISFHLNPDSAKILFKDQSNVDYLKSVEPIGCRDYKTKQLLEDQGIKSYFSFCLTTTLGYSYKSELKNDSIIFVDPLYSYNLDVLKKAGVKDWFSKINKKSLSRMKDFLKPKPRLDEYVPNSIIEKAEKINQLAPITNTTEELYQQAESIIHKYAKAKVVVTSRIHCALPCLALETPVLFIMDGLIDETEHLSRFRGILNHINILTKIPKEKVDDMFDFDMRVFHPNDIDWDNPPRNPNTHLKLAEILIDRCQKFIDQKNNFR